MEIFISYRRQDTSGYALALRREFRQALPSVRVFLDVESLDAGVRWRDEIGRRLTACDVMLVLIGDEWVTMRDGTKKIEQDNDPVRFEFEHVLRRDKQITIIPVLVEDARMPSPDDLPAAVRRLCDYNAHAIHDRTYDQDVNRLVEGLSKLADKTDDLPTPGPGPPTGPKDTGSLFPARITERFLHQEVKGMGRDQLVALIVELKRRGWTDEETYEYALSFSPLQPPKRLPARVTPAWLATNVPLLSPQRIRDLTTALRSRGWSPEEIRRHVFEVRQGEIAEEIPARITYAWLERNAPLLTTDEQERLGDIMLDRGWSHDDIEHYVHLE